MAVRDPMTPLHARTSREEFSVEDRAVGLGEKLALLGRNRLLILLAVVATAGGALWFSFSQPKTYSAGSRLIVRPVLSQAAFTSLGLVTAYGGPLGLEATIETQAEILRSGVVARRVTDTLGLSTLPESLAGSIEVVPVTDELLEVIATARAPKLAADMANAFPQEYLEYRRESATAAVNQITEDLRTREEAIERTVEELDARIFAIAEGQAIALDTERERLETERNELLTQLASIRARIEELSVAGQTASAGGGEVVLRAFPPPGPSSPKPIRDGAVGAMLGALLGVGLAFLREYTDRRIRTRDDAAQASGAPVLATTPHLEGFARGTRARLARRGRRRRSSRSPGNEGPEQLVSIREPDSPITDGYRALRASLISQGLGVRVRCLLVASVDPVEGATSTVADLGVNCARAGLSTVLIAAHFGRPGLHSYFRCPNDIGLAEVLRGEVTLQESLFQADMENLHVLPAGHGGATMSDLLLSPRLHETLIMASSLAKAVIIDAPPIAAGGDAALFARHADASILVVRANVVRPGPVSRAASVLRQAGAPLLGVMLLDAHKHDASSGMLSDQGLAPLFPGVVAGEDGHTPIGETSAPRFQPRRKLIVRPRDLG
jgi:capsular exopolysaccharide synthesis family protein